MTSVRKGSEPSGTARKRSTSARTAADETSPADSAARSGSPDSEFSGPPPAKPSNGYGANGNGRLHDTQFDQTWPVFTVDGASLKPSPPGDQTPNVTAVLRDLLGWRPVPGDAKAFSAALEASFTLTQVEGHVESSYVPRGYAMQADLGSVTGGQASLYARASSMQCAKRRSTLGTTATS